MAVKNIQSILVATDLSPESDGVVRTAASFAALYGASLHVIHVQLAPSGAAAKWSGAAADPAAAIQEAERELESQLRRALPAQYTEKDRVVVRGETASEIIRRHVQAVKADLIVLGPHRGEVGERPILGTTADRLVRTSGVPCLIVRAPIDLPIRSMGVLSDFSPSARAAMATATASILAWAGGDPADERTQSSPRICVAHIADPSGGVDREEVESQQIIPELRSFIDRAVERTSTSGKIEYLPEVLWEADPAEGVAKWVRDRGISLIVLGTQGVSRLPYAYIGSLASLVARTAPCPVLLVPPGYQPTTGEGEDDTDKLEVQRVVTAVDFHESSWEAALWAMRYFAPEAEHELIHVLDEPDLPLPMRGLSSAREERRLATRKGAERRLDELRDLGASPRVGTHVVEGRPSSEIVRLADSVGGDLIVVGDQGPQRGVGALLGTTAERVLFRARKPVLVARKLDDAPPRRLLVAIDDSAPAADLLAWTRTMLRRFNATAIILNVVDRLLLADELTGLPSAHTLKALEAEATGAMRSWLDARVTEGQLPASLVTTRVVVGDPSYSIISEAARIDADLVLVGSKGDDIARTPLIGRVVNRVVRDASCSVFVVPATMRGTQSTTPGEAE